MFQPELYVSVSKNTFNDAQYFLKKFEYRFSKNKGEKVLDIGCGPGTITTKLIKNFLPQDNLIVGGDVSPEMVAYATKHNLVDGVTFELVNIVESDQWILKHKESFHKVFSFCTIQRIENQSLFFENVYNLLKKGGEIFVTAPYIRFIDMILGHLTQKYKEYERDIREIITCAWGENDPVAISMKLLKEVGFTIVECRKEERVHEYQSIDQIVDLFDSVTPLKRIIPPKLFPELLEDIKYILINEFINDFTVKTKGCSKVYINLIILAKKL